MGEENIFLFLYRGQSITRKTILDPKGLQLHCLVDSILLPGIQLLKDELVF
jgi:hypothetical protein